MNNNQKINLIIKEIIIKIRLFKMDKDKDKKLMIINFNRINSNKNK